jgi:hypothetical protein
MLLHSGAVSRGLEMELNRFVRKWTEEQSVMSKAGGFTPNVREWLNSRLPEPEPEKPVEKPFDTPDLRKAVAFTAADLLWVLFLWRQVCITGGPLHRLLTRDYLPFRDEPHTGLFLTVRQPDHLAAVYNNLGVLSSQLAPRTDYAPRRDSLQADASRLYGYLQDLSLPDSVRQSGWYKWLGNPVATPDSAITADMAYPAAGLLFEKGNSLWRENNRPVPVLFSLNDAKNTCNYAITLLGQSRSRDTMLRASELFGEVEARNRSYIPCSCTVGPARARRGLVPRGYARLCTCHIQWTARNGLLRHVAVKTQSGRAAWSGWCLLPH